MVNKAVGVGMNLWQSKITITGTDTQPMRTYIFIIAVQHETQNNPTFRKILRNTPIFVFPPHISLIENVGRKVYFLHLCTRVARHHR